MAFHDCGSFKWPSSNGNYWHEKILRNISRDKANYELLEKQGWNVLVVWECELKKDRAYDNLQNLYERIISNK